MKSGSNCTLQIFLFVYFWGFQNGVCLNLCRGGNIISRLTHCQDHGWSLYNKMHCYWVPACHLLMTCQAHILRKRLTFLLSLSSKEAGDLGLKYISLMAEFYRWGRRRLVARNACKASIDGSSLESEHVQMDYYYDFLCLTDFSLLKGIWRSQVLVWLWLFWFLQPDPPFSGQVWLCDPQLPSQVSLWTFEVMS